ncbi:hypothetical protein AB0H36_41700 [Kribbella sp. NPDC050820]|uniref:hypothetical protein n=1 Tax=Kribbella sp. NPDC050820 TaxID=3155408 RepID=UPI00340F6425
MSTLAERRKAELAAKSQLLRDELAFWQGLAGEEGVLRKHHTQLLRLRHMLDAALDQLDTDGAWKFTTEQLLGLHHVWDFFRSKLALRLVEKFQPPLIAADELAWSCVRPLYDAAIAADTRSADDLREPPLAYFDSSGSPFAQGRRQAYRNLLPARRLSDIPAQVVNHLPVPVIGVPWHQQAHLPETAVIAHEAAHLVDDDLDLVTALTPALAASVSDQWLLWLPEVLADVLATLWLGPSYGQALSDLIEASPADAPAYPPPTVRMQLVDATIPLLGACAQPAEGDVSTVANIIACTPLPVIGNVRLRDIAVFTAAKQAQVRVAADQLRGSIALTSRDPRVLIAAGVVAFGEKPDEFVSGGQAALVFERIVAVRDALQRAEPGTADHAARPKDRQVGMDLIELLGQERNDTAGSPSTT